MDAKSSPTANSTDINEVTDAVEQLRKAMISADGAILNHLAADELTYGHSGGLMQNKPEFIHSFTSGESVFLDIELSNQTIRVVNDTAIVRHTLSANTNDKGKGPGTVKINILLVWIKNAEGEWKLLARQAIRV